MYLERQEGGEKLLWLHLAEMHVGGEKDKMACGEVDVYIHAYICYPSRSSLPVNSQPIP